MMWVTVYFFSLTHLSCSELSSCCGALNWTASGFVQLVLLFQGSMTFSESICLAK